MTNHNPKTAIRFSGAILILLLTFGLAACSNATTTGYTPPADAVASTVAWVQAQQNDDGGYGVDFETGDAASSVSTTLDALLALAGSDADTAPLLDYLETHSAELDDFAAFTGGAAGKIILALHAVAVDPANFAGNDWVARTDSHEAGGVYAPDAFNQALAILGLTASGASVSDNALQALRDLQDDDGSWDDGFGTTQNPDATALAILALLAGGVDAADSDIVAARDFLAAVQLPTGGWEYGAGFGESANTTAVVMQALLALGEDFYSAESEWAIDGVTPVDALLAYHSESGAFQFFGADDLFATLQSLPALAGHTYADGALEGGS